MLRELNIALGHGLDHINDLVLVKGVHYRVNDAAMVGDQVFLVFLEEGCFLFMSLTHELLELGLSRQELLGELMRLSFNKVVLLGEHE